MWVGGSQAMLVIGEGKDELNPMRASWIKLDCPRIFWQCQKSKCRCKRASESLMCSRKRVNVNAV